MHDRPAPTIWVLTDGKAGDEQPLIGVAEALHGTPVIRRIRPRKLFALLMPWGPIDVKDRAGQPSSPLAPPYPDICLATGRRAVAYLRALKKLSPSTLTVFFKDPRTRRHGADLLVVQRHDRLRADNALVVTTAPNRMTSETFDAIREAPPADLASLPHPRVAALIGGDSRHHTFTPADIDRLMGGLRAELDGDASLMITTSRRTPQALTSALADLAGNERVRFWDGTGDNPLLAYMALADELIVTADSTNMIGEAVSTGRPVRIFHPSGGHDKMARFIDALKTEASIGDFPGPSAGMPYAPVNATGMIAAEILARWRRRS
jgi:mitochondrial fission protein ELM1